MRHGELTNTSPRGYFGIGIVNPKKEINLGTLMRSAHAFGANFIFTIGAQRYKRQRSDTCASTNHLPIFHTENFSHLLEIVPKDLRIISVELTDSATNIVNFIHPERCLYIIGAEDYGISEEILKQSHYIVKFPGKFSINLAIAGSLIIYDRLMKNGNSLKIPA